MLHRSRQCNIEGKVCLFEKPNKFNSYSHSCAHTLILTVIFNQELYIIQMNAFRHPDVSTQMVWLGFLGRMPPMKCSLHLLGFFLRLVTMTWSIPTSPNVSTAVLQTLMQNSTDFLLQSLQQDLYKSELLVNKYSPFSLI